MGLTSSSLADRARRRRKVRDDQHVVNVGVYTKSASSTPVDVTKLTVEDFADLLSSGKITSVQLVSTYVQRCLSLGWKLNAITEEMYDEALTAATESDARRKANSPLSRYDGIPMSLKDQFIQKGKDSTTGSAYLAFRPHAKDGLYVQLLRSKGWIPLVRSNIPQCLMVPESDNHVFGRTSNPWDETRTCGGSSGGEGALIAARCTPVGMGTDIGGSIRIPAAFCGVFGFKPTPARLTQQGVFAPKPEGVDGQNGVAAIAGPLGTCVDDLVAIMRSLLVPELWQTDPTVPALPFNTGVYSGELPATHLAAAAGRKGLKVGYMLTDHFWEPASAYKRAVVEAAAALRSRGHEVEQWDPLNEDGLDTYTACLHYYGLMASDGALREFRSGLYGEKLHHLYTTLYILASIPDTILRPAVASILRCLGYKRMGDLLAIARARRADQYWHLVAWRDTFKRRFIERMQARGYDILLCPGLGVPAFKHGQSSDLTSACSYTFLWNMLALPAGTVPTTTVRADECTYTSPPSQTDLFSAVAKKAMVGAAGLPVAVQVLSYPMHEETCLRGMKELELGLSNREQFIPPMARQAGQA